MDSKKKRELAMNYKEDGNLQFKVKKYHLAVAAYTKGIKCKSDDVLVNVQLITNRAAAKFHLQKYQSSLDDCKLAIELKPDHFKAVKRGAMCCYYLKKLPDCIKLAEKALELDATDKEISSILEKSKMEEGKFDIVKCLLEKDEDLFFEIFDYLDSQSFANCRLVNHDWKNYADQYYTGTLKGKKGIKKKLKGMVSIVTIFGHKHFKQNFYQKKIF